MREYSLVLLLLVTTVATAGVTDRFQGPFANTFSDSQCAAIDYNSGTTLKQCLTWCETDPACTAVNFNERQSGGSCVRRSCPVPVPKPIGSETDPAWKGYSRNKVSGQQSQGNQGTNAWGQPAGVPGVRGQPGGAPAANAWGQPAGVPRDTLDDQIVRGPVSPGATPHSNSPQPQQPKNVDSRVATLESSLKEIKGTLDLLLDWMCEPNKVGPAKPVPTLACNNRKKAVVEEVSVASNVDQVDRARTRSHSTDGDGWSTVGAAKPRTPAGSPGGRPSVSSGPITTAELQAFTEDLIQKDTNNVAPQLRINRQGTTNSRAVNDQAQGPLVSIPPSALTGPTIVAFRALMDNYDPNVKIKDLPSNAEFNEQNAFLTEIMKTQVMQTTETFLTAKGKIRRPLRDVLNEIWFTMYKRSGNIEGSSGFEHSFIGEIKDGKVSGFHNWIQFAHEENDGDLDYKGFMKYVNLGNKGQVVKLRFNWLRDIKPVGSLFIGTSPELEMALYTVCFLVKPDQQCQVKLNKKKFNIQTWTQNYKGKKLIGSAYPDI